MDLLRYYTNYLTRENFLLKAYMRLLYGKFYEPKAIYIIFNKKGIISWS